MMKKPFQFFVALIAVLLIVQAPSAYAASLSELKNQQSEVEQQKKAINGQIDKKTSQIKTIEAKQKKLIAQIEKLGKKITETKTNIQAVKKEIEVTNAEIKVLKQEIAELQEKIDQRDALLEDRARAIQESGTVSYIDVLLGANSFVDFIDRFSAVNTLMDADRQIMRDQKRDKESLEEQKIVLENKKKELEDKEAKLQSLKASLDAQKAEKNKLIDELEAEQAKLTSEKKLLQKEYSEYVEVGKDLAAKIEAEQKRQAEAARKLEEQRKASLSSPSSAGNVSSLPVSNSGFMKPTNGVLTSPYGWRNLGAGPEFHYGIDLANSTGTPIVAAADGVVTYAAPLSSYGNVIMMTHSINGQIYSTVYAHLNSFNVSVGSVVSQGEQIAQMGTTGRSTGPHLHFEIHVGNWNGRYTGAQNPLRYISL